MTPAQPVAPAAIRKEKVCAMAKPAVTRGKQEKLVRFRRISSGKTRRGRPVIPGWRSDVSNVSMIRPLHSAMARLERNPIKLAKMMGAMKCTVPSDVRVYPSPAKGSMIVKVDLRTKCDVQVTLFSNVMLSVLCL